MFVQALYGELVTAIIKKKKKKKKVRQSWFHLVSKELKKSDIIDFQLH